MLSSSKIKEDELGFELASPSSHSSRPKFAAEHEFLLFSLAAISHFSICAQNFSHTEQKTRFCMQALLPADDFSFGRPSHAAGCVADAGGAAKSITFNAFCVTYCDVINTNGRVQVPKSM